ncbi:tetratricopeptide repeat protein, partial [Candidatus Gracilibacteria bacterium]|nr:tetratricopeptide repeat protein [Candidatus Gracilibacteria bacterium]
MQSVLSLADVLREQMQRAGYPLTPGLLSKLSGVPKSTIVNWLEGRVARPRRWEDLLRVADALRLDEATTNMLLAAAGHVTVAELRNRDGASALLRPWVTTTEPPRRLLLPQLPTPPTALVGRSDDLARLRALLLRSEVRLVTLTGIGGSGKTRLALQVAFDLQGHYSDGIYFVALASLKHADLVVPSILEALNATPRPGELALTSVVAALRTREVLLVLDNFEHVRDATPALATLLSEAAQLTILVTSRSVLNLYGEHVFEVPALPMPDPDLAPAQLAANPAVDLFVQRARLVDASFSLDSGNARTIATICERLEGLPLSIELAAARVKLLTPRGLLARLNNRLSLLSWGSYNLLQRHRTLRETLDWSYSLLAVPAQLLFRQLAVFMGGGTVEAVEAVVGQEFDSGTIIDLLMVLTDNSLLQSSSLQGDQRYLMLETVREYALEKLREANELAIIRQRHVAYVVQLVTLAEPELTAANQGLWLMRLDAERDNIRAALSNALEDGDAESAGRIASGLRHYWSVRGQLAEGRRWLALALAVDPQLLSPSLRANMLFVAGRLARQQGDLQQSEQQLEAARVLYSELGDQHGLASALGAAGVVAYDQGAFERSAALHAESLALRRALGDSWGVAATLTNLGEVNRQQGNLAHARELHAASLNEFRAIDDTNGVALAQVNLGLLLLELGEVNEANGLLEEGLILWHRLGEQVDIAECLEGHKTLPEIYRAAHEYPASPLAALLREAYVEYEQEIREDSTADLPLEQRVALSKTSVESALERTIAAEMRKLENRLVNLATASALGPFIGLFGTVW